MDDLYESRRKHASAARQRQRKRQERTSMVVRRAPEENRVGRTFLNARRPSNAWLNGLTNRARILVQDAWWYLRNTPVVLAAVAAVIGLYFVLFAGSHLVQGRIFPNVWALGVYIGDMTDQEAQIALLKAFNNDVRIRLIDDERTWTATTSELGLKLDPEPMLEEARKIGLAGMPLGWSVEPVVETDYITAQNFLLDLSQRVEIQPLNANYQLRDGNVVGIPGSEGRILDVGLTLEQLTQNPGGVAERRRLDLIMQPLSPDTVDPQPYLDDVIRLAQQPIQMSGYDPYTDQTVAWTTTPETFLSWLEAGPNGLTLRDDNFMPFLNAQVASLNPDGQNLRYLEPVETLEKMQTAIADLDTTVDLRVRYRPVTYEIEYGDSAYSVSRKTGIPFFLIEQSNPGRDLNVLSPGDKINLPSRDVAVPLDPVKNKRIVVDIPTQSLVAYENGQQIFSWKISTGISSAPTAPGTYQILTHDELAYGSSYTLCGSQGCGQWTMHWFMGIYEVQPGLVNGFHG
ncbi:MAG: peptidoglycan binding domain-containing protein, partial [Anaerolineae bacterium]|nr:peptidoglycan binding domain-containing protein [Anaerolineae bacterium]